MSAEANRGAVAAGHEATVEAAAEMLRRGGNAVDAAVAGALASLIAEPVLTGLFGGGVMIVRMPDGSGHILDFFARMPGLGGSGVGPDLDFYEVDINFGPVLQRFHVGRGAAAAPGTYKGLFDAHRRWGALPTEAIVEPACDLAERGVALTPQMAYIFTLLEPILMNTERTRALFAPEGRLLVAGERHRNPDLGNLLGRLAREGLSGPTGTAMHAEIVRSFGGGPGLLTERDLVELQPVHRPPLSVRYRDAAIMVPGPPTMGGALVALGLQALEGVPELPVSSPESLAWMAEIQRCMTEARSGDPMRFLEPVAVEALKHSIAASVQGMTTRGSTTHISVIDAQGMAVGITHSNGEGCGHVVPGTGVMMNNFLGEEDINPAGFHKLKPAQSMGTMMCPTVVDAGDTAWVLGSGGSNRIRTAILQVIHNLLDRRMPEAEAVARPRMHVEGSVVNLETNGQPAGLVAAARGMWGPIVEFDQPNMFFGGVHVVRGGTVGLAGAGDVRRGGAFIEV